jgi:Family 4 Glycosyltransferase in conflict systems
VFAGAHVSEGSSAGPEAEYMALHPQLGPYVVELAAVSEQEKAWLYRHTAAIVYPTVHEGFGLLPFEAAEAGVPCVFGSNSSLAELLPSRQALIAQWDAQATAERVIGILTDDAKRADLVRALRAAAARLTWASTGKEVIDVYQGVWSTPMREARVLALELTRSKRAVADEAAGAVLGYDRMDRLMVAEFKEMPELQRALLGVANRRGLRTIIYGPIIAAYRFAYLIKNRKSARKHFRQESERPPA